MAGQVLHRLEVASGSPDDGDERVPQRVEVGVAPGIVPVVDSGGGQKRLGGANLKATWFGGTIVADVDLALALNLDKAGRRGPSPVSTSALERSKPQSA